MVVNGAILWLMFFGRPEETSYRRLLWLCTKTLVMLDWGSSTLDNTTAGIVALCWCWQCLLTFGGNLLPRTVTPLDVTTVAWCCRQTQDVLHPAECPPWVLQTSQWQWIASVFTTCHCTGSNSNLFTEGSRPQHNMTLSFGCWSDTR